jgi:phosphoglycolate phosphatase-like HAD superfamily hydrolase
VLWDVDHTLIENNGVNKETYALAFHLLTGRQAEYPAQTGGRTDPEIMRNMMIRHGIELDDEHAARLPEALEAAMSSNASRLRDRGHELPGARDALATLQVTPGIIQSVLSGNIKVNAIAKLSAFELDKYVDFEVGGYGSDDHIRANLVRFARERASVKYRVKLDKATTVVIGDTPRDVQAGRNGGAYVIGVASGGDSAETLRDEGADAVFPDLRDTRAVVAAITSRLG